MKNKKILILVNHDIVIYNFRLELVERLLKEGYEVIVSSPKGNKINPLIKLGVRYVPVELDRHSINPFKEIKLFLYYLKLISKMKPKIVLTFTIKPNIYGGLAAKFLHIPYIVNITGLGMAVERRNLLRLIIVDLYKAAFGKAKCVFFQNSENMKFFEQNKINLKRKVLIPGSGVNTKRFSVLPYPNEKIIKFAFISRIMKEKGIDEYLEAAKLIRKKYPDTQFHICGFCEEKYEQKLKKYEDRNIIIYHGMIENIKTVLKEVHCVILPSYHEGMSNALLEAAATGRAIITTDVCGCKEIVQENISGYLVEPGNVIDLVKKIEQFIYLSWDEKQQMGIRGRKYVIENFERDLVVQAYVNEIDNIEKEENTYDNL